VIGPRGQDGGLAGLSAVEAAAGMRGGAFSPRELLAAVMQRIHALQPEVNAYITVMEDEAMAAAVAAERALVAGEMVGPLCGVPVALKDIVLTAGIRTTGGSRILRDYVPAGDATVVRLLRAAGAVFVGKTNTHEFAFGPTTINPHYGPCRNPHNTARVSGGSSGGSAAAVATGQAHLALGTDTGGSIRIPAAACGVVGLKPTYGRVSKAGVLPLSWSLDHVGPIARTVADVALLLSVIAGPDPRDHTTAPMAPVDDWVRAAGRADQGLKGLRVGLPRGWDEHRTAPAARDAVRQAAARCEHLGATVREVEFPAADAMMLANRLIILAEAAAYHLPWLTRFPDEYGADVRARLELGQYILAADYLAGQRLRSELTQAVASAMTDIDVALVPTLPVGAPLIGQHHLAWDDGLETVPDGLIRLVAPFNVTGQPALALPYGTDEHGMPLSVQIVGRPYEEAVVLRAAAALEHDALARTGA
jgi:aspartyl-tRNA(Asn)/glutamyl-tRNA(Gln) amidotransferase subunit A